METLGSLCDKLTIIKLKQFHSDNPEKLKSLSTQEADLCSEIDLYVQDAVSGKIPAAKLLFDANKVYKQEGNEISNTSGNIGEIFSQLAKVNCDLWHEQEKVYDFEQVPAEEKNTVVKQLAILNLERNQCMDAINKNFQNLVFSINK